MMEFYCPGMKWCQGWHITYNWTRYFCTFYIGYTIKYACIFQKRFDWRVVLIYVTEYFMVEYMFSVTGFSQDFPDGFKWTPFHWNLNTVSVVIEDAMECTFQLYTVLVLSYVKPLVSLPGIYTNGVRYCHWTNVLGTKTYIGNLSDACDWVETC